MTKKQLLSEAQRRQFMKLAMIKPIHENWGMNEADEEMGMDTAPAVDMGAEEVEASASEGEVEITKDELDKFVDLASAAHELAQKLKGAVPSEEGEEMEAEEGEEMGEDEIEKALQEMDYQPSREEVVNEVAKRVAKRLVEAQKAEKKMNEALGKKRK